MDINQHKLHLITDRTQSDAAYAVSQRARVAANASLGRPMFDGFTAEERTEWFAGLRGAYNASDYNRVGEAMIYISDLLRGYGYNAEVDIRTDFVPGLIYSEEAEAYLQNIKNLVAAFVVFPTTPPLPDRMAFPDIDKANAIERNLQDVYILIQNMVAEFIYCGEIYAGEDDWV